MGLFLGARRSLTAVAVDYVELLELGRDGFVELQRDHPQATPPPPGASSPIFSLPSLPPNSQAKAGVGPPVDPTTLLLLPACVRPEQSASN